MCAALRKRIRHTRSRATRPITSPCIRAVRFDVSASGSTFFTIGHSNRSVDELVALLRAANVTLLVDVRTIPRSRPNPQFNLDVLPQALSAHGIDYAHIAELGGLRGRQRQVPSAANAFWQNQSFHNYADYAASEPFRRGLDRLRALARGRACAVMCAESVWWRCHRRIIADYLLAVGERVFHIMGPGQVQKAVLTDAARRDNRGILTYPASTADAVAATDR
jgi:uncharacterized protein (DUF488 family)